VTLVLRLLGVDFPTALRAETENLTGWPFVKPVSEQEAAVDKQTGLPLSSVTA